MKTAGRERAVKSAARDPAERRARLIATLSIVAIVIGVIRALQLAWMSDDAYISFRYARNLNDGLGLVYNAGERVEGYSNFLWTLWSALGMWLGVVPEVWANIWSIACFAATIALLGGLAWQRVRAGAPGLALPFAALGLALHRDADVFATSGLETATFTMLATAGYVALEGLGRMNSRHDAGAETRRGFLRGDVARAASGALLLGLAALTRPDGVLFAAIGGIYVVAAARPRLGASLVYFAVVAAIGVPYALWKLAYYGDLFPNTYYAKSAGLSWWGQGFTYVQLYFRKYWILIAGPLIAGLGIAAWRGRLWSHPDSELAEYRAARRAMGPAVLAIAFASIYILYVAKVGGDFMFARLLLPATPFLLLSLELGLGPLSVTAQPAWGNGVAVAALALISFWPQPFEGAGWVQGIVEERYFYTHEDRGAARTRGEELYQLTRGLPIRGVLSGGQALEAYYSRLPVVIEGSTGLTDAFIAHQKLEKRGRVGHEKSPPYPYLIDQRHAHFYLGRSHILDDSLLAYIPVVHAKYKSVELTLLTWDPPVMNEFRRRGAEFDDYLDEMDHFIRDMRLVPDDVVEVVYTKARRFYFQHTHDPVREAPFLARLSTRTRPRSGRGRKPFRGRPGRAR